MSRDHAIVQSAVLWQGVLLLACALWPLMPCGCKQTGTPLGSRNDPQPSEEIPLLLNEEPLLLLDEDDDDDALAGPDADNRRCFVCHVNYMEEQIAVKHAQAGIGCAHCHGESDAHIADESWASGGNGTAPEIMFTKGSINSACMACHAKAQIDTVEHEPLFIATEGKTVCTDCHGNHRLVERRCSWK